MKRKALSVGSKGWGRLSTLSRLSLKPLFDGGIWLAKQFWRALTWFDFHNVRDSIDLLAKLLAIAGAFIVAGMFLERPKISWSVDLEYAIDPQIVSDFYEARQMQTPGALVDFLEDPYPNVTLGDLEVYLGDRSSYDLIPQHRFDYIVEFYGRRFAEHPADSLAFNWALLAGTGIPTYAAYLSRVSSLSDAEFEVALEAVEDAKYRIARVGVCNSGLGTANGLTVRTIDRGLEIPSGSQTLFDLPAGEFVQFVFVQVGRPAPMNPTFDTEIGSGPIITQDDCAADGRQLAVGGAASELFVLSWDPSGTVDYDAVKLYVGCTLLVWTAVVLRAAFGTAQKSEGK